MPRRSRWTSFVADPSKDRRARCARTATRPTACASSTTQDVLLIKLSGEDGDGWTVFAVDRATRRVAVAQAHRQIDATEQAYKGVRPL